MDFLKKAADTAKQVGGKVSESAPDLPVDLPDEKKIRQALAEALDVATKAAVTVTSAVDGFLKNDAIKIGMPENFATVSAVVSKIPGLSSLLDEFVEKMNRAAEAAAAIAFAVFGPAIAALSFEQAAQILRGKATAATEYFERTTRTILFGKFMPIVEKCMGEVGVMEVLEKIKAIVKNVPFLSVPEDGVTEHVTNKGLDGLFLVLGEKETDIRQEPAARVTPLLAEVFTFAGK